MSTQLETWASNPTESQLIKLQFAARTLIFTIIFRISNHVFGNSFIQLFFVLSAYPFPIFWKIRRSVEAKASHSIGALIRP